jgi:2-haloacid dehalogenase
VAGSALAGLIERRGGPVDRAAVDTVLDGFSALEIHPDVPYAFAALRRERVRIAALTNGTADSTTAVLDRAGVGEYVERVITIEEVQRWKPHPRVYEHAAEVLGLPPRGIALVAAHAWDVHGAQQAGMVGAFVRRAIPWARSMGLPDVQGATLPEVCELLIRGARLERRAA